MARNSEVEIVQVFHSREGYHVFDTAVSMRVLVREWKPRLRRAAYSRTGTRAPYTAIVVVGE